MALAEHPSNKNEVLAWDLAYDPNALRGLDAGTIRRRLFSKKEDLGEQETRLPIKSIHINKSPFVINDLRVLSEERIQALAIDMAQVRQYAAHAAALPDMTPIWRAVYQREPGETPDVDENLYGGFVSPADRRTLNRLRSLSATALAHAQDSFEDPQLQRLFYRYRARNFPESLSPQDRPTGSIGASENCGKAYRQAVLLTVSDKSLPPWPQQQAKHSSPFSNN